MQELIDKLAKERKEHLKRIESITINDIKKLVSRYNSLLLSNVDTETKELCTTNEDKRGVGVRVRLQAFLGWRQQ